VVDSWVNYHCNPSIEMRSNPSANRHKWHEGSEYCVRTSRTLATAGYCTVRFLSSDELFDRNGEATRHELLGESFVERERERGQRREEHDAWNDPFHERRRAFILEDR